MLAQPDEIGLRTVHLYGPLAVGIGKTVELAFRTPAEAIRLIELNWPGFANRFKHGKFHICLGPGAERDLDVDRLNMAGSGDLHLMPRAYGRSRGKGILTAILGGLVIGAAFFFSGGTLAAALPGFLGSAGATYGTLASFGMGLVLNGIGMVLTKTPDTDYGEKSRSFAFDGPVNVTDQGGPVPVVLGKMMTGTVVLSASVDNAAATSGDLASRTTDVTMHMQSSRAVKDVDLDNIVNLSAVDVLGGTRMEMTHLNGVALSGTSGTIEVGPFDLAWRKPHIDDAVTIRLRQGQAFPTDGARYEVPVQIRVDAATAAAKIIITAGAYSDAPNGTGRGGRITGDGND